MEQRAIVYIIDDDASIRRLLEALVEKGGMEARAFADAGDFLAIGMPDRACCIILDLEMPGLSGLEMLEKRLKNPLPCPVIMLTGHGSVRAAVKSLQMGAVDFLEKPFEGSVLMELVHKAVRADRVRREGAKRRAEIEQRLGTLSPRERELLAAVIEGKSTKMIADELHISARTADHHRANLMQKMQASNVADLVRIALEAGFNQGGKQREAKGTQDKEAD